LDTIYCITFLADRTNGRAYATELRLSPSSSVVCDVMYCGQTVRPRAKVTKLAAYWKSCVRNRLLPKWMTLTCLEVVLRSCQPLRHICRWISPPI